MITGLDLVDFPGGTGIFVGTSDNEIVGNTIRVVGTGITVAGDDSGNNAIGGLFGEDEGNQIWSFTDTGVNVDTAGLGNHISGNTIGLDPEDEHAAGGNFGIRVNATAGTIIGHNVGTGGLGAIDYDRANVVAGSAGDNGDGILLTGGSTGTVLAGNIVGTNRDRTLDDVGNAGSGIFVNASSNNQLGPGNVVTRNGVAGVAVNDSTGIRIVANSIHLNGAAGISVVESNPTTQTPTLEQATLFGTASRGSTSASRRRPARRTSWRSSPTRPASRTPRARPS